MERPFIQILLILYLNHVSIENGVPSCFTKVRKCPENELLWKEKEELMQCRKSNEIYACMMFQNHFLVEMCLSDIVVLDGKEGRCPFIIDCLDGKPVPSGTYQFCDKDGKGCPPKYHGGFPVSQLYKYPACLNVTEDGINPAMENTRSQDVSNKGNRHYLYLLTVIPIAFVIAIIIIAIWRGKVKCNRHSGQFGKENERLLETLMSCTDSIFDLPLISYDYHENYGETRKIITTYAEVFERIEMLTDSCDPVFIFNYTFDVDEIEATRAAYAVVTSRRKNTDVWRLISVKNIPEEKRRNEDDMLKWVQYHKAKLEKNDDGNADMTISPRFWHGFGPFVKSVIYNNNIEFDKQSENILQERDVKELLKQAYHVKFKSEYIEKEVMMLILLLAKKEFPTSHLALRYCLRDECYVILGYYKDDSGTETEMKFCGMNIDMRNKNIRTKAEYETSDMARNDENDQHYATCVQLKNIKRFIKEHSSEWWAHSNLIAITSEINGSKPHDFSIILVCLGKGLRPLGDKNFPKHIEFEKGITIRIRVTEGYFSFCHSTAQPSTYHDSLCFGSDISAEGVEKCGSLGLFIEHEDSLKCITTCHIIDEKWDIYQDINETFEKTDKAVIQPGSFSMDEKKSLKERRFGTIDKVVFRTAKVNEDQISVDAALLNITRRKPSRGIFVVTDKTQLTDTGYTPQNVPVYNSGNYIEDISSIGDEGGKGNIECKTVVKSGSETGFTKGFISMDGVEIRMIQRGAISDETRERRIFKGQYGIRHHGDPFATDGDSGAAVFLQSASGELQCLGIIVGFIETNSYGRWTIVTPITALLKELGLTPKNIKRF